VKNASQWSEISAANGCCFLGFTKACSNWFCSTVGGCGWCTVRIGVLVVLQAGVWLWASCWLIIQWVVFYIILLICVYALIAFSLFSCLCVLLFLYDCLSLSADDLAKNFTYLHGDVYWAFETGWFTAHLVPQLGNFFWPWKVLECILE